MPRNSQTAANAIATRPVRRKAVTGRMIAATVAILAVSGWALTTPRVLADVPVQVAPGVDVGSVLDQSVQQLITDLGVSEFDTRQRATETLKNRADLTVGQIAEQLSRPDLSIEQRLRLNIVGKARFAVTPRGALGVEFDLGNAGSRGSVVRRTIPNFPANGLLLPGDEIIEVDGESIEQNNMGGWGGFNPIRPHIVANDPGVAIKLKVVRHGPNKVVGPNGGIVFQPRPREPAPAVAAPVLEIEVPLGSFAELPNSQPLSSDDFNKAWVRRLARLQSKSAAANRDQQTVIGLPANAGEIDWTPGNASVVRHEQSLRDRVSSGQFASVAMGGESETSRASSAAAGSGYTETIQRRGDAIIRTRVARDPRVIAQPEMIPGNVDMAALTDLMALTNEVSQLQMEMLKLQNVAADPTLTPEDTKRLDRDIATTQARLRAAMIKRDTARARLGIPNLLEP